MKKNHYNSAIHKASLDTTRLMSAHLRTEAQNSGWPDPVVRNLHVRYSDGEFNVYGHKNHTKDIQNLEYGTPSSHPTAALRRFANRTTQAETFFVSRLSQHLGEQYL